jgi:hypothetical protein
MMGKFYNTDWSLLVVMAIAVCFYALLISAVAYVAANAPLCN